MPKLRDLPVDFAQYELVFPRSLKKGRVTEKRLRNKGKSGRTEKKFTLNFRGLPLGEALRALAKEAGYAFVAYPNSKLSTPINLSVKKLSFKSAVDLLCKIGDVVCLTEGQTLTVLGNRSLFKRIDFDVPAIVRVLSASSLVTSGSSKEDIPAGSLNARVTTVSNSDPWRDVGCTLCSMAGLECNREAKAYKLCSSQDNSIVVVASKSTNSFVVKAPPSLLQAMEDFVKHAREKLSKQVILDIKIAEVEVSNSVETGIDWNQVVKILYGQLSVTGNIGISTSTEVSGAAITATITGKYKKEPFNILVKALSKYGTVKVLSSPRLVVLNNQGAVIKVGRTLRFVTDVSSTTDTETNTSGCDVTTDTFFTGVSVMVVPTIEDGEITLYLHPSVTELKDVRTFKSECGEVPIEEPEFSVREVDTIVKLGDNGIVLVGGLSRDNSSGNISGVPLLKDIPGLGKMFSYSKTSTGKSELFIYLKAKLIQKSPQ